jgi:cell division protein FtsI/penicillin-binding protein 2
MRRRDLWAAALTAIAAEAGTTAPGGTALLLRLADRRVLIAEAPDVARRWLVAPGSTIKPFTLLALLQSGRLAAGDVFLCPLRLNIEGRSFNCTHPRTALPMNPSRAIAYSCNCAVAHFAQRFASGELARFLVGMGFSSATQILPGSEASGAVTSLSTPEACQLQSLGEEGIEITSLELLRAYGSLARRAMEPQMAPIIDGLEGAVQFGTAQLVQSHHVQVAAKTGSIRSRLGLHAAWIAGFAPSRTPEVAFTALVQGRAGGSDAAPIARRMLASYFGDRF